MYVCTSIFVYVCTYHIHTYIYIYYYRICVWALTGDPAPSEDFGSVFGFGFEGSQNV